MTDDRPRRGSALALELRRKRAEERRLARAAAGPEDGLAAVRTAAASSPIDCAGREPLECIRAWFAVSGWQPFAFQEEVWRAYRAGESGLVHAATGTGKTYAVWLGPVLEWLESHPAAKPVRRRADAAPLRVLWITPLRALAADTAAAIRAPVVSFGLPWTVETRTGDTPERLRERQRDRLPTALVTTPESLSLLLTRSDAGSQFEDLELVVVDEWHELLASKRGVQTELGLARLRRFAPGLRVWGLSATLGNLDEARETLLGTSGGGAPRRGLLVRGLIPKALEVDALIPATMDRFPWAGQIGLTLLPRVVAELEQGGTTLLFTNTRSFAERWYQELVSAVPHLASRIAIHHGSLERATRESVEDGIRTGALRCVVCTSTLDLGVDFAPVDRVLQVGSPKTVGRLIQRAGRSGHQPGAVSRVTVVPTHALELVDTAAARDALAAGDVEARAPIERPLDVLTQHIVTIAMGGGFESAELLAEVRSTHAYAGLTDEEWQWSLDLVTRGGPVLGAYPEYARVVEHDGRYTVEDRGVARRHRLSIGTIVSDPSVSVRYLRGGTIGSVEESFIARLRPGDRFTLGGRLVELVRVRDLVAWVRRATGTGALVPRWTGTRLPLSPELARALRGRLDEARRGLFRGPEMEAVRGVLELQADWSRLPAPDELLVERLRTREGHHLFFYPVEGRLVHEGLAALFAYRLSQLAPLTVTIAANDYGFELLAPAPMPLEEALEAGLLRPEHLAHDIPASLNAAELARRQFREVARVAGLVFTGFPGRQRSDRQLQASSGLLYDVFARHDPDNLLLLQARREVLERQLEAGRLGRTLDRLVRGRVTIVELERPSPFAFPLLVDRTREQVSSEKLADRVRRMRAPLERAASAPTGGPPRRPRRGAG